MEAENEVEQMAKKIQECIDRSAELLQTNKHYEFTQKIKTLAQRRTQTKKINQAEILLKLSIKKMLAQEVVDFNAMHDLIVALLELYESNKSLWSERSGQEIYVLLTQKPNEKNIEYFSRILRNLTSLEQSPQIVDFIIDYYEKRELFYRAESLIVHLDLSRIMVFLEKWHNQVDQDQFAIIVCRMALLKGLLYDFDEPMVLLSELDSHNPFVKFVKFLILAVQMKSRESFQKIGLAYKKFLDSDDFFENMYDEYGVKFFKKEKGSSGLLNLLQS